jgi:hypothetical protein
MTRCQCRSGFFSLRDCDEPVSSVCSQCGRAVCARHLSPASGYTTCLDCHGRQAHPPDRETGYGDDWVYGYRDTYYRSGYGPIYSGSYYDSYYDSYDTRSFDRDADGTDTDDDAEDRTAAGFGDS